MAHHIGINIQRSREKLGWTRSQLAERSDLSAQTVRMVETRNTSLPTMRTLGKLAAALGKTVEQLTKPVKEKA